MKMIKLPFGAVLILQRQHSETFYAGMLLILGQQQQQYAVQVDVGWVYFTVSVCLNYAARWKRGVANPNVK